jgi:osmoprotectant transport system permease protein
VSLGWLPLAQQVGKDFFHDRSSENCIQQNKICPGWAIDNFDRYTKPAVEHIELVLISVVLGFAIAMGLALISHRRRWLVTPITALTGALYTIPSIAFFFLLLPLTGRGDDTAIIALTVYTLQIIYRNIMSGLANVPESTKDAARGMGLTEGQLLWKVELPLAVPEIIGGLRIATVSTVAIATLAVFAHAGGLGTQIYGEGNLTFPTSIVIAGAIAIAMALTFDTAFLFAQRLATPWRRAASEATA